MRGRIWKSCFLFILAYISMSSTVVVADQFDANDSEDIATFFTQKAMQNIQHKRYLLAEQDINKALGKLSPHIFQPKCLEQKNCQRNSNAKNKLLADLFAVRAMSKEFRGMQHAAISDYQRSLKHNQHSVENQYQLAILYSKHHRDDEAMILHGQIEKLNMVRANSLKQEMETIKLVRDLQALHSRPRTNPNDYTWIDPHLGRMGVEIQN